MWLARFSLRSECRVNSTSSGLSSTSKISIGPWIMSALLYDGRPNLEFVLLGTCGRTPESEVKRCSLVQFSFSPNAATVFPHDAVSRRQTHACAFEVFGPVQTLEHTK